MLRRSVTTTILIVIAITAAAAVALWSLQQQTHAQFQAQHRLATAADAIRGTLAAISAAQQGYVAPGQLDEPLFEKMSELLLQLDGQVDSLGAMLTSSNAAPHVASLSESVQGLKAADARARENLLRGQELMAADVIYSDGQNVIETTGNALDAAQESQQTSFATTYAQIARTTWMLFGTMALIWVGACAAVIRLAKPHAGSSEELPPVQQRAATATVDRSALAAICTDLSRASDARELQALLGRCAKLLHASGLMLWMGAGDRLFGALAHGYPAEVLPRLGPIPRDADNVAAEAWRDGRQVVRPGDEESGAALVTPLFSPEACVGVLAVELPRGRAADEDLAAAASVVAAQLATVVSAWPAASMPQSDRASSTRTA